MLHAKAWSYRHVLGQDPVCQLPYEINLGCQPLSFLILDRLRGVFSFLPFPHLPKHHYPEQSKMPPKSNQSSQNWDEPGLVKDLLAATVAHLNPSRQDILQIANKAKAMGGWQFTEGAC